VRVRLQREVDVEASARAVWDYVTDWPRQGEWVPLTRVERVDAAADVGGRFRAWTGLGPLGFWDPMTITAWERSGDGGGRCEVLHLGTVVKGEGEFVVLARGPQASRFVWAEVVDVPLGGVGAAGWRVARPVAERLLDRALHRMRRLVEEQTKMSTRASEPS
jgi:polyketide cyclase/dehydrase/lipid transport protein